MSVAMLVVGSGAAEPAVGPDAAERLGALGVTRILLLRDADGVGIVLEGWAFDPARVDDAVRALFPSGCSAIRTLHEIEHVALSPVAGGRRD